MSTRDLSLIELFHARRDAQELALVARHAPVLRFDAREPFLPLAAGYTIFSQDGPSPSMERQVQLSPPGRLPAEKAIEYAIWWDWDIHHLYELEHVWVYLDGSDRPVRVEASWHGEYHEIPLQLENDRAVLLSEPGKHAFAPTPGWFHERTRDLRRNETLSVGAHACVLIKPMFAGRIRQQAFDQTLVRSFLVKQAFTPAWEFSKTFTFRAEWLVPWPELEAWIPGRVNICLERLEKTVQPRDYQPLRLFNAGDTLESARTAASLGAEALLLPVFLVEDRLRLGPSPASADLEEIHRFCSTEPVTAVCAPVGLPEVEALANFVGEKQLDGGVIVRSNNPTHLARYRAMVPQGTTALELDHLGVEAIAAAEECGVQYVQPGAAVDHRWIEQVHSSGLGVISWQARQPSEVEGMRRLGVDILWQAAFPDLQERR